MPTVAERRSYSQKEVNLGLAAYAMGTGRAKDVLAILKDSGLDIPIDTLRQWAYRTHKERYEQIKREVDAHVRSQLADAFTGLANSATELQAKALDELHLRVTGAELLAMSTDQLLKVLHQAAVASGINTEKSQMLAGKPTQIVRNDFPEIQRILKERHGVTIVIAGQESLSAGDDAPAVPESHQLPAASE